MFNLGVMNEIIAVQEWGRLKKNEDISVFMKSFQKINTVKEELIKIFNYNNVAEIITIGDEILIGQIVDTNFSFFQKKINSIGIDVDQHQLVIRTTF